MSPPPFDEIFGATLRRPAQPTKPTVQYTGTAVPWGCHAMLTPVDHPGNDGWPTVTNGQLVTTSQVISWDKDTGRIETRNTIYVPVKS